MDGDERLRMVSPFARSFVAGIPPCGHAPAPFVQLRLRDPFFWQNQEAPFLLSAFRSAPLLIVVSIRQTGSMSPRLTHATPWSPKFPGQPRLIIEPTKAPTYPNTTCRPRNIAVSRG